MRIDQPEESEPELPSWWDEVEKVEVLHKEVAVSSVVFQDGVLQDEELPVDDLDEVVNVSYETGDELPLALAEVVWSAFSDRLAAYDDEDERLDSPSRAERRLFSAT